MQNWRGNDLCKIREKKILCKIMQTQFDGMNVPIYII